MLSFISLKEDECLLSEEPVPLEELEQTLVLEELSLFEESHEFQFVKINVKLDQGRVILVRDLHSHLEESVEEQVNVAVDFLSLPICKTAAAAHTHLLRPIELFYYGLNELLSSQALNTVV